MDEPSFSSRYPYGPTAGRGLARAGRNPRRLRPTVAIGLIAHRTARCLRGETHKCGPMRFDRTCRDGDLAVRAPTRLLAGHPTCAAHACMCVHAIALVRWAGARARAVVVGGEGHVDGRRQSWEAWCRRIGWCDDELTLRTVLQLWLLTTFKVMLRSYLGQRKLFYLVCILRAVSCTQECVFCTRLKHACSGYAAEPTSRLSMKRNEKKEETWKPTAEKVNGQSSRGRRLRVWQTEPRVSRGGEREIGSNYNETQTIQCPPPRRVPPFPNSPASVLLASIFLRTALWTFTAC